MLRTAAGNCSLATRLRCLQRCHGFFTALQQRACYELGMHLALLQLYVRHLAKRSHNHCTVALRSAGNSTWSTWAAPTPRRIAP